MVGAAGLQEVGSVGVGVTLACGAGPRGEGSEELCDNLRRLPLVAELGQRRICAYEGREGL